MTAPPLAAALSPCHGRPSLLATSTISASHRRHGAVAPRRGRRRASRISCSSTLSVEEEAAASSYTENGAGLITLVAAEPHTVKMKATATLCHESSLTPLFGRILRLELVSPDLDPRTGKEQTSTPGYAWHSLLHPFPGHEFSCEATFDVPASFGSIVAAVLVENEHDEQFFLKKIVVAAVNDDDNAVTFEGNSWIDPKSANTGKRVFFPLKSCLPSETPPGVKSLRESELKAIRGDGSGERKELHRIYDYDVYNDLGNPEKDEDLTRPVLGGTPEHPYPRRCKVVHADQWSEKLGKYVQVPRDEAFSPSDDSYFFWNDGVGSLRPAVAWTLDKLLDWSWSFWTRILGSLSQESKSVSFPSFTAIDSMFETAMVQPHNTAHIILDTVVEFAKAWYSSASTIEAMEKTLQEFKFQVPQLIASDKFAWFRDEEFARQTLAGLNPLSIQLVTEFPFVSKLDEKEYGPRESGITKELIEEQIGGVMTVEEAVQKKKLFMLDYHDMLLPFVNRVRELEGTTLYGSRTLFFLTQEGTLRPIAIELTRPKGSGVEPWSQVFTPQQCDGTGSWLWRLAKAHVLAHDSGYHQLVSHWLRTHCCVEPYIIAANRQLSRMHPIYRLLHPHFRYTMQMNAKARGALINAGGIIEETFSPGRYGMELSSAAYRDSWRFDMEALPADLIRRGMAVQEEDGTLTLTIEDYPYANDGLLVWNSLKEWTSDYVKHYYGSATDVTGDEELKGWWDEVRTKGHADKKDESWWPKLDSRESLIEVLTSIMWVTSGHHAAVNFAQYPLAGYFPNHPTIARKTMPVEEGSHRADRMKSFLAKPEKELLEVFPSQYQALTVMTVLHILSSHWPDEQEMGEYAEPAWKADPMIDSAFQRLRGNMEINEGIINGRNANEDLKNRCGAGVMPYELFKRSKGAGDTGMGLPYSISI